MNKPLLVGETNPYGGKPEMALFPAPEGSSGYRLCVSILGMGREDYLESFDRLNLVVGDWEDSKAKFAAYAIRHQRLILLGSRVCKAFGVKFEPFKTAFVPIVPYRMALVLPHPSGLCRIWNDPDTIGLARESVIRYAPEVAKLVGRG